MPYIRENNKYIIPLKSINLVSKTKGKREKTSGAGDYVELRRELIFINRELHFHPENCFMNIRYYFLCSICVTAVYVLFLILFCLLVSLLLTFALRSVGEFEAASLSHVKINANIQNKIFITISPNGFLQLLAAVFF